MILSPQTNIQYISMDTKNLSKFISPVNDDYIFLFDIDDTLYKLPPIMEDEEERKWKYAYEYYKTDTSIIPNFKDLCKKASSYEEAFKMYFNRNPYEVEKIKGFMKYEDYVKKDVELKSLLESFPYRTWCFTNGMKCRAEEILECLNITNNIEGVVCMEDGYPGSLFMGKPRENAYKFVEDLLGIKNKSKVYFFDDRVDNIEMGVQMGWNSILVSKQDNLVDILKRILDDFSENMER